MPTAKSVNRKRRSRTLSVTIQKEKSVTSIKWNSRELEINMDCDEFPISPNRSISTPVKTPRSSRKKKIINSIPRTADRRRSLFSDREISNVINEENNELDIYDGIRPLSPDRNTANVKKIGMSASKKPFKESNRNLNYSIDKRVVRSRDYISLPKQNNRAISYDKKEKANSLSNFKASKRSNTDELQKMFHHVNLHNRSCKNVEIVYSTDEEDENLKNKKNYLDSPRRKRMKINKLEKSLSPTIQISTKSFYSNNLENEENSKRKTLSPLSMLSPSVLEMIPQTLNRKNHNYKNDKAKPAKQRSSVGSLANKGVGHSIRKRMSKNKQNTRTIDDFLKTIKCDKLKCLPSKRVSKEKVEEVHKILKNTVNSIEMARPLNIDCERDTSSRFSMSSDDNESLVDETILNVENKIDLPNVENSPANLSPKKINKEYCMPQNSSATNKVKRFFKSGHTSAKEIKITENIKLGVSCGKMSLLSEKKKKNKNCNKTFSNEQAAVNDIINSLTILPEENNNIIQESTIISSNCSSVNFSNEESIIDKELPPSSPLISQNHVYKDFRARIPFNTIDPNEIERQHLLLDFLITNNICTEKNFEIFISDPDNHKEEADEIINNMVEIVNDDLYKIDDINLDPYEHYRNQIPYNTNDPGRAKEQGILLDFLIEHNICTEENFTIFIKELETRKDEAEKIIESVSSLMQIENPCEQNSEIETENIQNINLEEKSVPETSSNEEKLYPIFYFGKKYSRIVSKFSRDNKNKSLWRGAIGQDQLQIDAGQKEFGAKQCSKCGLVYTVHEPEEEAIHKEYHDSIYFLKFRGWIDEDVVANYFEWSNDGRIIRITSCEHVKKKERLMELLKIVDKELGFASYILPDNYVAFLAVRKNQFVGLCLVQFLSSANRYVKINGVDCCTEESFDAKIGISRIWVSPLCRRMGIASKLLLAARSHAVVGQIVDVNMVAFSAPTEDGKSFAQKICKRTDFLIYQ